MVKTHGQTRSEQKQKQVKTGEKQVQTLDEVFFKEKTKYAQVKHHKKIQQSSTLKKVTKFAKMESDRRTMEKEERGEKAGNILSMKNKRLYCTICFNWGRTKSTHMQNKRKQGREMS